MQVNSVLLATTQSKISWWCHVLLNVWSLEVLVKEKFLELITNQLVLSLPLISHAKNICIKLGKNNKTLFIN